MSIYYLYVKTHNKTGLRYLGKTKQNPFKYSGSGVYWKNHIAVHGNDLHTDILLQTNSPEEIKVKGQYYSGLWNIVESSEWANLKPESGDGGHFPGQIFNQSAKDNQRKAALNREKRTCVHCGITCSISHFKFWHGDNCKSILTHERLQSRNDNLNRRKAEKITCEHCNHEFLPSRYKRRHGEKCSRNPTVVQRKEKEREEILRSRPKFKCLHCSAESTVPTNITRWHNDNCKFRPDRT